MGPARRSPTYRPGPVKFPYGQYEVEPTVAQPDVTVVHRPVIPVRLIGTSAAAVFYGLLDTGADESLIPREIADFIGIEEISDQISTVLSASGEMPVHYGVMTIECGTEQEQYRWRAAVGIVNQPWKEALLGHAGFLDYFDATFFGGERQVQLMRNAVPFPG